jgi:hypothetical protein
MYACNCILVCIHVCIKIKNIMISDFFFLILKPRLVTGKIPVTDDGLFFNF